MTTRKKDYEVRAAPVSGEAQALAAQQAEPTRARATFAPRCDIHETNGAVHLTADLPGVEERDLDITLEKSVLTIRGRVPERTIEGWQRVYSEFADGDWVRTFQLSNEVDASKIEATLKNGVLRLSVPKHQPSVRKIAVRGG